MCAETLCKWESIKTCKKDQKPVALRYWYIAWRCGVYRLR